MSITDETTILTGLIKRITALERAVSHPDATKVAKAGDTMTGSLTVEGDLAIDGDLGAWTGVSFQNSWFNYAGFQAVQYRKIGDIVQLRGLARKNATFAINNVILLLPAGFRPSATQIWTVRAATPTEFAARVDVETTGAVVPKFSSSDASGNWISFHHSFSIL